MLQIFRAQEIFLGAIGAQDVSYDRVPTSMGGGVQRGCAGGGVRGGGGGWCQPSQVSAPDEATHHSATTTPYLYSIPLLYPVALYCYPHAHPPNSPTHSCTDQPLTHAPINP